MGHLGWTREESEDLYNHAPCGYHSLDRHGTIVRINETELRWLGYERGEVVGKVNINEVLSPESRPIFEANFSRFQREGYLHGLELNFVRKNGTTFSALLTATAIHDEDGNFVMSRSILFDISERKWAENRFQRLLEAAPDAMVVINKAAEITLTNAQLERLLGYGMNELLGQKIEVLVPERLRPQHIFHRMSYLSEPAIRPMGAHLELYGRRKDGSEVPVEISLSPLDTDDDMFVCAAIRDITERKMMQEALRQSEERFRNSLRNSPVVVFNHDRDLRYTWIIAPHGDWPERHFLGRTDEEILGDGQAKELTALKRAVLDNGTTSRAEISVMFQGQHRTFDLTMDPQRDALGNVTGLNCAATDISALKRAMEERGRLIDEIATAQSELAKKNVELEALNKEKTRWLGMATHDLRDLLSAIIVNCEILTGDPELPGTDQMMVLKSINSCSQFMLELLDDVSDISAIESGARRFSLAPTDLEALIKESVALLLPLANRKGTVIETVFKEPLPLIRLDPRTMQQVFHNLIGNAIKYSQDGARVKILSSVQDDLLTVIVQDNGPGVPPAELDSIFLPFQRAITRTARGERSTGLGLAICKRIVEFHGGRIWAENAAGGGAAFHVSLAVASLSHESVPKNQINSGTRPC